jgi:hypothetical protein
MAAALAKVAIGFALNACLSFSRRLNDDPRHLEQIIKTPAGDRIPTSINDDRPPLPVRRAELRSAPNCRQSSRQSAIVVKQFAMVYRSIRLLKMYGAILANRQQLIRKPASLLSSRSSKPFTDHSRHRGCHAGGRKHHAPRIGSKNSERFMLNCKSRAAGTS